MQAEDCEQDLFRAFWSGRAIQEFHICLFDKYIFIAIIYLILMGEMYIQNR